ncbi:unnamed protein product, partial [Rhizoctonia solani]
MEASNNKDSVVQALEHRIAQQEKYFNQVNERLEQMEKRIESCNRISLARTMNSHLRGYAQRLYPVPLPNGGEVPEDQFPTTKGDVFDLTDQAVMNLIKQYGLENPDGVPEVTE